MYLEKTPGWCESDGTQHAGRGRFLLLVQCEDDELGPDNFRALVRSVALRQVGHWMMGFARVKGERLSVSGSYGQDGLPMNVSRKVYDAALSVPRALYDAWSKGGGHNSAGSEEKAFRKWALETFPRKP